MLKIIKKLWAPLEPAIREAARNPSISEPVHMMIDSMREKPHNWVVRVVSDRSESQYGWKNFAHAPGPAYVPVVYDITDRKVGYTYRVTCRVQREDFLQGQLGIIQRVVDYPEWLTHAESQLLGCELCELLVKRVSKVRERMTRQQERKATIEREAAKQIAALERQRVMDMYKEKQ
jgi:hypothetical protein